MELTIHDIIYKTIDDSNARLIDIPIEGQTYDYIPQDAINNQTYPLSIRNGANVYNIPTDKPNVYVNFIPKKQLVTDSDIQLYIGNEFSYFRPPVTIPPIKFTLIDGQIFRCVTENSLPMKNDEYTYYIMVGNTAKKIPNYKTLEVMLDERNQTLLSVKILTEKQCSDIEKTGSVPDKSSSWNSSMSDVTSKEMLNKLNNSVKSGAAIAEQASASAASQVSAVKAQAEASKAEAEAAKAASEQAIAEANAKLAEINKGT